MKLFTLIILVACSFSLYPQEHHHEHNHHHDKNSHNGFELGLGLGPVYSFGEKTTAMGMHLHGLYNIRKIGFGLGFETVFADVIHNNASVIFAYRPIEALELVFSPGILLENEETGEHLFSLHFEAIYLFELGDFGHLGPVLSYSFAKSDQHIMAGIHLGIDF